MRDMEQSATWPENWKYRGYKIKSWDESISVAYRYRKSISIIELFVSIYIDIYRVLSN